MCRVFIVKARRTSQGRLLGGLSKLSSLDMAVVAGRAAIEGVKPECIDQIIVGNVLMAGAGMNLARQVGIATGIPIERGCSSSRRGEPSSIMNVLRTSTHIYFHSCRNIRNNFCKCHNFLPPSDSQRSCYNYSLNNQ